MRNATRCAASACSWAASRSKRPSRCSARSTTPIATRYSTSWVGWSTRASSLSTRCRAVTGCSRRSAPSRSRAVGRSRRRRGPRRAPRVGDRIRHASAMPRSNEQLRGSNRSHSNGRTWPRRSTGPSTDPTTDARSSRALGVFWLHGQRIADGVNYGLDTIERFAADPPPSWYRAVASAAAVVGNAGMHDRLRAVRRRRDRNRPTRRTTQTALARLELATLLKRVLDEGLTDELLAEFEALDERAALADAAFTGFNATMLPVQFLVIGGRIDEAPARHRARRGLSRVALIESYAAILRGDFDRAATRLREGSRARRQARRSRNASWSPATGNSSRR